MGLLKGRGAAPTASSSRKTSSHKTTVGSLATKIKPGSFATMRVPGQSTLDAPESEYSDLKEFDPLLSHNFVR